MSLPINKDNLFRKERRITKGRGDGINTEVSKVLMRSQLTYLHIQWTTMKVRLFVTSVIKKDMWPLDVGLDLIIRELL